MDVPAFLNSLRADARFADQLAHVEVLEPREARYGKSTEPLHQELTSSLVRLGIKDLYVHQVESLDAVRSGKSVVVVSGTASGKTLCYNLPVLDACYRDASTRALYLYPTKALAQDQHRGLLDVIEGPVTDGSGARITGSSVRCGVFDGDTPTAQRRRIKAEANIVLSNPDMLHASILPYHPKWARFFESLQFVVLDEVHTYRGILGAHVANVLRRLRRVCQHYGSDPVFVASSATIANPKEHAEHLVDIPMTLVNNDGSPRGAKYFALWDPGQAGNDGLASRSSQDDAVWIMSESVKRNAQTLAFTRTRQAAELIGRYIKDGFRRSGLPYGDQIRAYRGGYLPEERRAMEEGLSSGQLTGVATTNALELGVDIGSLDVVLLVQYPGTIASVWQQAGRSGRRQDDSLAILIAGNDPVDQYLLRHPEYFFAQTPEQAVVDPSNPYVVASHLRAAAFELPLMQKDLEQFGDDAIQIAGVLCETNGLSSIDGSYYFSGGQNPAQTFSLRHMSDNTFSIVLHDPFRSEQNLRNHEVIGNVDAISAPELIYPEAVYLHNGETYFVRELDLEGKVAFVEASEMDYYTQAILESHVTIEQEQDNQSVAGGYICAGDVDVRWKTVAFKKIKFTTRENIGFGPVDIPEQSLPTTALWFVPDKAILSDLKQAGLRGSEALSGLRNLAIVALPMLVMCDSRDISGVVDTKNLGRSTLIVYDRYPGGLGYCEKGYEQFSALLQLCHEMVMECPCDDGCPSCVGLPNLRPAIHSDPDLSRGYPIPNKEATQMLLELLVARNIGENFEIRISKSETNSNVEKEMKKTSSSIKEQLHS